MAHKTLIGGTAYNIIGGKSLIDGTGYNIKKGRTLVDGTGYDINFIKHTVSFEMDDLTRSSIYSEGIDISSVHTFSDGELLSFKISANDQYKAVIYSITVTSGGETVDLSAYLTTVDASSGVYNASYTYTNIPVTQDLVFTIQALRLYKQTVTVTNGTASPVEAYRIAGGSLRIAFTANEGFGPNGMRIEDYFPGGSIDYNAINWLTFTNPATGEVKYPSDFIGRYTIAYDYTTQQIFLTMASMPDNAQNIHLTFSKIVSNTYTVTNDTGANYGFELNATGYYESQNQGQINSAALTRINLNMATAATVKITFINYAETTWDYGIFGNLDATLSTSYDLDDASLRKWTGNNSNSHMASEQSIEYEVPAGTHFIMAKYRKDSSNDYNNDSLQFKVEIVRSTVNTYTVALNYEDQIKGTIAPEYLSGSTVMNHGESLTLRLTIIRSYALLRAAPTATMGGEIIDLTPYITTGATHAYNDETCCKTYTINNLPITGDLVINVIGYVNTGVVQIKYTAENGTVEENLNDGGAANEKLRQAGGSVRLTFIPNDGYGLDNKAISDLDLQSVTNDPTLATWLTITNSFSPEILSNKDFKGRIEFVRNTTNNTLSIQYSSITPPDATFHITFSKISTAETHTVSIVSDMTSDCEFTTEYLSGGPTMEDGELLTVRVTSKTAGVLFQNPIIQMNESNLDVSQFITTGTVDSTDTNVFFKTFTLNNIPVTGDLTINLMGELRSQYLITPSAANGTCFGEQFAVLGGYTRLGFIPAEGYGLDGNAITGIEINSDVWSSANWLVLTNTNTGETLDKNQFIENLFISITNGNLYIGINRIIAQDITCHIEFTEIKSVSPITYNITRNLTNVVPSNWTDQINAGNAYSVILTPVSGYKISGVTVIMGRVDITGSAYYASTGEVSISSVTGDIIIAATATKINSYTVTKEEGATHGFSLGDDGWYINDNKGVNSSAALARINLSMATAGTVTLQCVNYAEPSWDFGYVSYLDTTLSLDWAMANSDTDGARKAFNQSSDSSTAVVSFDYEVPAGDHFIVVKFKKDGSGSTNGDCLKFQVIMPENV